MVDDSNDTVVDSESEIADGKGENTSDIESEIAARETIADNDNWTNENNRKNIVVDENKINGGQSVVSDTTELRFVENSCEESTLVLCDERDDFVDDGTKQIAPDLNVQGFHSRYRGFCKWFGHCRQRTTPSRSR